VTSRVGMGLEGTGASRVCPDPRLGPRQLRILPRATSQIRFEPRDSHDRVPVHVRTAVCGVFDAASLGAAIATAQVSSEPKDDALVGTC
jgi:hypothetical protein